MNSFPHYLASVVDNDGKEYQIHFIGLFSDKIDAVPLVLLHGWPGIPQIAILYFQHFTSSNSLHKRFLLLRLPLNAHLGFFFYDIFR